MAGYQGRSNTPGNEEYINATAFNSQIKKQRKKIIKNAPGAQSSFNDEQLELRGGLGVAKSTTTFFDQFNADEIMEKANDFFGDITYNQADPEDETFNPDFAGELNLRQFKNYNEIIIGAQSQVSDDAPDQPGIGIGPNLLSPGTDEDLSLAMRGQFPNRDPFSLEMLENNRRKGYGWYNDLHKETTIGNYLSDKYKFNNNNEPESVASISPITSEVLQGESINTSAIDYNQD